MTTCVCHSELLAEAVERMRRGQVIRDSGYDGEYGKIRFFTKKELARGSAVSLLFSTDDLSTPSDSHTQPSVKPLDPPSSPALVNDEKPSNRQPPTPQPPQPVVTIKSAHGKRSHPPTDLLTGSASTAASEVSPAADPLDADQQAAVEMVNGPLLIVAGPGTGKTRTLTYRVAHLIRDHKIEPEHCLTVTFTNRAAIEMRQRLEALLGKSASRVPVMTFHALGWSIVREQHERLGLPGEQTLRVASEDEQLSVIRESLSIKEKKRSTLASICIAASATVVDHSVL